MGRFVKRGPRGTYREFEQWFTSSIEGPKESIRFVEVGQFSRKTRAYIAMQIAERRGRTDSWAYRTARRIMLLECGW